MKKASTKRILILVPSPKSPGGIAHYYEKLKPYFASKTKYFIRGVRNQRSSLSKFVFSALLFYDYLRFFFLLVKKNTSLVVVNTSLGISGILRDVFFIKIAKWFRLPYIVFFRGIDDNVIRQIEKRYFRIFKNTFLEANKILVLSSAFRQTILGWGYQGEVDLETTVVDQALFKDFDLASLLQKYAGKNSFSLLFLSRIEKQKGIYEALKAFEILERKYPTLTLTFCGDGSERELLMKSVPKPIKAKVFFTGAVYGKEKSDAFKKAHVFVFPSYKEGMPNALLEAMAFGLPIVTTEVGGIPDFFINGEMGYMIKTSDPKSLAIAIEKLFTYEPMMLQKTAINNHYFALEHFVSERVVQRLENHFHAVLND